jgi:Holliday junction resolvase RusA-like endonuclease
LGEEGATDMNATLTPLEDRELIASFVVQGEPVSKSRARFTKRGSKMVSYTPQKTLDGEKAIAAAYLTETKQLALDAEATYAVHAHFINGTRQRRDVDNMVKLILDGLNNVAWPDDNQVTEIAARKSWATKAEARTEVTIYRIGSMNRPSKKCIQCGTEMLMYASTTKRSYCSKECMSAKLAETRVCVCKQCGIEFDSGKQARKPLYCSMECKSLDMTSEVKCKHCGSIFRRPQCYSIVSKHFCSTECRDAHDLTCVHGHPWADFMKRRPNGTRYCSECNRLRAQKGQGGKGDPAIVLTITELEEA